MKIVVLLRGIRERPTASVLGDRLGRDEQAALSLAVELARTTPGAHTVTTLTVGDDQHEAILGYAAAHGANAVVRLWDEQLAEVDTQGIALSIAATLRHLGFDLLLAGRQSEDLALGSLGPAVAESLDLPHLIAVHRAEILPQGATLRAERYHDGRLYAHTLPLPSLLTVVPAPRKEAGAEEADQEGDAEASVDRGEAPAPQLLGLRDVGMDAALLEGRRPFALHPQPDTPPAYETAWVEDVDTVAEHLVDLGILPFPEPTSK